MDQLLLGSQIFHIFRIDEMLGYTPSDVFLLVLPFYHIYGQALIMLGGLRAGAKTVILQKFQPKSYLEALQKHKVFKIGRLITYKNHQKH